MRIVAGLVVAGLVVACGGSKETYDPPPSYLDWAPEQKRAAASSRSTPQRALPPQPEPVGSQELCTSGINYAAEQCWTRGGSARCADVELSLAEAQQTGVNAASLDRVCADACEARKANKSLAAYKTQLACVVGANGPALRLLEKDDLCRPIKKMMSRCYAKDFADCNAAYLDSRESRETGWGNKGGDLAGQMCQDACRGKKRGESFETYWTKVACKFENRKIDIKLVGR